MSYLGANPRITTQQFRPQSADPSNPFEGMVFRADGTSRATGLWEYRSGSWQPLAAGVGGLDVAFQLQGNENISTWSTGNNATFLGGGALGGVLAYNTSTPLNGDRSYEYTQAAGSLNDYIASPIQSIPLKFRGNFATVLVNYTYNGGNSDMELVVYDVTNATKLTLPANSLIPVPSAQSGLYKVNIFIPQTCTQIRFGFQTKVLNSGKILKFDDVILSADTTLYADPSTITEFQTYTPPSSAFGGFGTVSTTNLRWRKVGSEIEIEGSFVTGTVAASEARLPLPNNYVTSSNYTTREVCGIATSTATNNAVYTMAEVSTSYLVFSFDNSTNSANTKANGNAFVGTGGTITVNAKVRIAGLTAENPQIITATESFSSDSAQLVYAGSSQYTLSTLSDAPVGTFITFTYAASTNTRTQTNAAPPTQTTSDMNVNGIRIFSRAFNATSTAASPAVIAVQIGKNLKGKSLDLYKSTGKVTSGNMDHVFSGVVKFGFWQSSYNEATGILYLDAAFDVTAASTTGTFPFSDQTNQSDGYLVINASRSPALTGVPQALPRIATISDVKSSGSNGGSSTAGSYQTRTLNTLVDNFNIVSSLASNQFTLVAGTYYIESEAPCYAGDFNKSKIRNITDSTDALLGQTAYANAGGGVQTNAIIKGIIEITATKTFELQHRVTTGQANIGYGRPATFGDNETYSVVKITKIR